MIVVSSVLKPIHEKLEYTDDVAYYNELLSKYDMVVCNQDKVKEDEFVNGLSDKSRVEILVNKRCRVSCPWADEHYKAQIDYDNYEGEYNPYSNKLTEIITKCRSYKKENPDDCSKMEISDIEDLKSLGYSRFKLEGRDLS